MHNTWTDAENFLLVEKLVQKSEEEAWREVAEKCDGSSSARQFANMQPTAMSLWRVWMLKRWPTPRKVWKVGLR